MKKKKVWLIPLIIGVVLIVGAIIMFATTPADVEMGSANWFDNETARSWHFAGGFFMLFVGITAVISSFMMNVVSKSKTMDLSNSVMEKIKENIEGSVLNSQEKTDKYCEYCGSKLDDGGNCKNCGAKQRKK